ncbi:hypothetical protein V6Z11_D11G013300 [Gossypium hirsutum]
MSEDEQREYFELQETEYPETVPSVLKHKSSKQVVLESETSGLSNTISAMQSISISMPSAGNKIITVVDENAQGFSINGVGGDSCPPLETLGNNAEPKAVMFLSRPMSKGSSIGEADNDSQRFKDKNFDSFKTWSGKLERQITSLSGRSRKFDSEEESTQNPENEPLPVDRYFDALEGPELETLRSTEEIMLPDDKTWPFLLRFPISSFGICLGVGSQSVMWKALASTTSTRFLHISLTANLILWWIAVALVAVVSSIYLLKVILYFEAVRPPSVASMAWAKIRGSFDYGSRIAYFIALFLYFSLAVRVNFFRGFKFSLAWWAYTFPMTGAAIATMQYSSVVTNVLTQTLAVILSLVATLTVTSLLVTTMLHAFVLRDLFPNDVAIAISDRKPKHHRKWFHIRHGGSEWSKDIETFLKFANTSNNDIEAALNISNDEAKRV